MVATMISEITSASKEQAQGIQEINKAISQLDQVTQQNSAVAQQSSSQAEQLSAEAHSLSEAVQTLVAFVDGAKRRMQPEKKAEPRRAPRSEAMERKVVPIKAAPPKKAGTKSNGHSNGHSNGAKKAVGADAPSADDPHFEEF